MATYRLRCCRIGASRRSKGRYRYSYIVFYVSPWSQPSQQQHANTSRHTRGNARFCNARTSRRLHHVHPTLFTQGCGESARNSRAPWFFGLHGYALNARFSVGSYPRPCQRRKCKCVKHQHALAGDCSHVTAARSPDIPASFYAGM